MKNYRKKYEAIKKPFKTNSAVKKRIERIFKNTEIKNKAIHRNTGKTFRFMFR